MVTRRTLRRTLRRKIGPISPQGMAIKKALQARTGIKPSAPRRGLKPTRPIRTSIPGVGKVVTGGGAKRPTRPKLPVGVQPTPTKPRPKPSVTGLHPKRPGIRPAGMPAGTPWNWGRSQPAGAKRPSRIAVRRSRRR